MLIDRHYLMYNDALRNGLIILTVPPNLMNANQIPSNRLFVCFNDAKRQLNHKLIKLVYPNITNRLYNSVYTCTF